MIYYTSDLHLCDPRIIDLCERPFNSMSHMEDEIRKKWNNVVRKNDTVYMLGDIAYDNCGDLSEYIMSLNGNKNLIVGNHDGDYIKIESNRDCFEDISLAKIINDDCRNVCICHYPIIHYESSNPNSYHVYGHLHNNRNLLCYDETNALLRSFNAGVDVNFFTPVTLDQMISLRGCVK
jgi:calcineurin-like phosphoesterase family protein